MNLNEKQTDLIRQEVLDAMALSAENRELAEKYLNMGQAENQDLLRLACPQDFSNINRDNRGKCLEYLERLYKQEQKEELARFVRFCAAVGGSTCRYTLFYEDLSGVSVYASAPKNTSVYYTRHNPTDYVEMGVEEYLTPAQQAAVQAEMLVWDKFYLNMERFRLRELYQSGSKEPHTLRDAMDLCYHGNDNAKILLAALYLSLITPLNDHGGQPEEKLSAQGSGIQHGKGQAEEKDPEGISSAVEYLERSLVATTLYGLTVDGKLLSNREKSELEHFFYHTEPMADFADKLQAIFPDGVKMSDYRMLLLTGAAFFAMEHSDRLLLFVRFMVNLDYKNTLKSCMDMCGMEWFVNHIGLLEQCFPVKKEDYIRWCITTEIAPLVQRLANSPGEAKEIEKLLPLLTTREYLFLICQLQKAAPVLYQTVFDKYNEEFRRRIAGELVEDYPVGKEMAFSYLLGEVEVKQLYPFSEEWKKKLKYNGTYDNHLNMVRMRDGADLSMFRRAVVLDALNGRWDFFAQFQVYDAGHGAADGFAGCFRYEKPMDQKQIQAIFDVLEQEELSVPDQLAVMERLYHIYDGEILREQFAVECVDTLALKRDEWEAHLVDQARNGSNIVRFLCIRVLEVCWDEYKEVLLACAADGSRQEKIAESWAAPGKCLTAADSFRLLRGLLLATYASHRECEAEICAMLSSKKGQVREMAIQVLGEWGAETYRKELEKALETEKSKKVQEQIRALLGDSVEMGHTDVSS